MEKMRYIDNTRIKANLIQINSLAKIKPQKLFEKLCLKI